jgi:hypothetical protein
LLALNSKNKNIRDLYGGINECEKGSQPKYNLVDDENGDLLPDTHNILNMFKNCFSHLLNICNIRDIKQKEVHLAEPLAHGPNCLEVEIGIAKLKRYKSSRSDQITAELIQS